MQSTIIHDLDGNIIESGLVNTGVFRTPLSFVPMHADGIVQFHKDSCDMSKLDKYGNIHKYILKEDNIQLKFQVLSETFSMMIFNAVKKIHWLLAPETAKLVTMYSS